MYPPKASHDTPAIEQNMTSELYHQCIVIQIVYSQNISVETHNHICNFQSKLTYEL